MMPVEQHARHQARAVSADAALSPQVPRSGPVALPAWESFPLADRQRLVTAILQAACRQVACRSASRLAKT